VNGPFKAKKRILPVQTYAVTIDGAEPVLYEARSPMQALAAAWRHHTRTVQYMHYKPFLSIAKARRAAVPVAD
jgi:hypothetical protein